MANYDEKTGIHYGVISPNSICQETLNDLCDQSVDTVYEESKEDFTNQIKNILNDNGFSIGQIDEVLTPAIDCFNENYENDNHGYEYTDKEYILHISDDNFGIFVIKSPYYTFCRQCSPCAPGAGDLDNPISYDQYIEKISGGWLYTDTAVKAYCLPREFFDDEYSKIPYRYYRVDNDKEEIAPIIEVN
jgi:hypothetical protein